MKPKPKYGLSNFLRIANEYINPDPTTLIGVEKRLKAWFAFTYDTTMNDDRLLDMTLEELLVLFQMHRLKSNPEVISEIGGKTSEDSEYENWLKQEMGENYLTDTAMVEGMVKEEKEYQTKIDAIKNKLPSKITTDFNQFEKN